MTTMKEFLSKYAKEKGERLHEELREDLERELSRLERFYVSKYIPLIRMYYREEIARLKETMNKLNNEELKKKLQNKIYEYEAMISNAEEILKREFWDTILTIAKDKLRQITGTIY